VALLLLPAMVLVMTLIACIEWLYPEPNWNHYKSYFSGYTDMLTFK